MSIVAEKIDGCLGTKGKVARNLDSDLNVSMIK